MARKPKTQPSPDAAAVSAPERAAPGEAAALPRLGRQAKAAALSSASPPAAGTSSPAADDAGADAPKAGSAKAPGRKGPGRKPKQAADTEAAPSGQNGATEPQDQASGQLEAEASLDLTEADAPAAAVSPQAEAAADRDPVQPDRDPAGLADEAAQSVSKAEVSGPAAPAARWDRTTGVVEFDWPAIEQVAAQSGPNQGMAKLLVAARAEGAGSRWPF